MRIHAVGLKKLPPFADTVVEWPAKPPGYEGAEVHLLTGQNGTGKTRLLSILAAALGNRSEFAERFGSKVEGIAAVIAFSGKRSAAWILSTAEALWYPEGQLPDMTHLLKGDAGKFEFSAPSLYEPTRRLKLGVGLASAMAFRGATGINDAKVEALKPVELKSESLLRFDKGRDFDTVLGQSMVNIKMQAAMESMHSTPEAELGGKGIGSRSTRLAAQIERALSRITGRSFTFSVTPYPKVSLKVIWGKDSMTLAQLPDGIRCILGWLVTCVSALDALYPEHEDPLSIPLILLLDEPEGHLHPEWQRKLLPAAQALFPNAQIFVATHSPFIISSVNDGWIHILRAGEDGAVTFDKPKACSKGDSYLDVVEDVLGVKEWYDPETEKLLAEFREIKQEVLGGSDARQEALQAKAQEIADRSDGLSEMMGGEMRQIERLKQQARVGA